MTKIALCLSGYFDSFTDKTSKGIDGFKYIHKKILSVNEKVDVYVHSWDIERENEIKNLYKPKNFIFENQIDFSKKELSNYIDVHHDRVIDANRLLSQSYTVSKSIELACESEIDYDIIIKSRFDLGRINRSSAGKPFLTFNPFSINRNFWRNKYPVQCINFDKGLDMNYYYFAKWNLNDQGPADMWWYSSKNNMRLFSEFYSFSNKMLELNSNFTSIFKKPNYIFLLKYFMKNKKIWEKCKFLQTKWE